MTDMSLTLKEKFIRVLEEPPQPGRQKEQTVQDFLELHSEMIPTPNLLNHKLYLGSVISKFPIKDDKKTDYAYITKSSDEWLVTFVELERPEKNFFTNSTTSVVPTAEFYAALQQVRDWKIYIDKNESDVIKRLQPLITPTDVIYNPVRFDYQLIMGRSENKNLTQDRKFFIQKIREETKINILSYDTLINSYENSNNLKKNIIHYKKSKIYLKFMHINPENMFSYLTVGDVELTSDQIKKLNEAGYEMDKWLAGERLSINGKSTWSKNMY
jgi:hypothetical protein